MAGLDALLHGRVPSAVRKELGGFSTGCPPSQQLRATSPRLIPALPSHTPGPGSAVRAGMEPIRTNPTGSRPPAAWELLSTLRAAPGVRGPR